MTSVLTREEFHARTREELRARLMALVLTAVLVWYTLVVPPYAPAPRRAPNDDEGADGEVRHARGARAEERAGTEAACVPVEELDWPEYIGLD
ncbi:MAG: hypothetical protein ACJ74Q_05040 [Pyrinomonadaceae bacterium]|jgi:hypothetical protein